MSESDRVTDARRASGSPAATGADGLDDRPVEDVAIDTIRTLAMDAVEEAQSGHPGTPMALAPLAYLLYRHLMRHNPANPDWFDRDRFVLSAGHASMLLYASLHLTGYEVSLEEIRNFRQWGSRTPGHPENFRTPGVETTTGPLGQGVMNSVGMALAEAHLAARFNRPGHRIVDHRTWAVCSDGDLMEGASHEAASLAGHLGLGKLIWIYDDNRITIDGSTDLAYSDDATRRFEAYGWHVTHVGDRANDLEALRRALEDARSEGERPSLVIVRSHIGYGAPGKQDTAAAHGAPLGEEEVRAAKRSYGWPEEARFLVPERARRHMREARARGERFEAEWRERLDAYRREHPDAAESLERTLAGALPEGWDADLPTFSPADGPLATRKASGEVLDALAPRVPWLIGGSADLTGSNKTHLRASGIVSRESPGERNLRWGVREHLMCAASSGMALHGGVRPYAGTFFVFTDYARPAIRLAAMMELPVVYVLTHDSIGLGEDGPTHQPVEHLASFRAMPGVRVIRPADAAETVEAWRVALERDDGPTLLVLTRQAVPVLDRTGSVGDGPASGPEGQGPAAGLRRGGYVLAREGDPDGPPDLLLLGTGSEVQHLVAARARLEEAGIRTRVVSLPCWELFREQSAAYRRRVLPPSVRARISLEAAATQGWAEWVGEEGVALGLDRYGESAPFRDNFRHLGFTPERVVERALALVRGHPVGAGGGPGRAEDPGGSALGRERPGGS